MVNFNKRNKNILYKLYKKKYKMITNYKKNNDKKHRN